MSERNSASAERAHHRKHSSSNKVLRTITFVLTPFLMLLFVFGLFVLVLLKPYADAKPYIDFVFNQDSYITQGDSQVNIVKTDTSKLNVRKIEADEKEYGEQEEGEEHYIIYPDYGDLYARLTIENANMIDLPVYAGWNEANLEKGVGWFNGSVYIGKVGNVVLAAHNHTYFFNLPLVKVGDIVKLETDYVKLTYVVKEIVTFHEDDVTYIGRLDHDRLVMYTCWNNGKLGMSQYRLGVLCDIVEREWKKVEVPE